MIHLDQDTEYDTELFGWDPMPGIVSIWADREGQVLVWQRQGERVTRIADSFRPWLFATVLDDLAHVGLALAPATAPQAATAPFVYRELDGPPGSYRYLITSLSGRALETAILAGATRRLGRAIRRPGEMNEYYQVGPVEQYLMATGRVYFRGLRYADLHRLQFDLETTALDPAQGRIFLVAVRDSHGLEAVLEAPAPADEARLIADLCDLIRERDPDVLENHNLFGFDLPFLEARAAVLGVPLYLGRAGGPLRLERYADPTRSHVGASQRYRYSVAGRECIDTLDAVRRHDFVVRDLPSHRLKDVARAFGIASPERVYLAGEEIFPTYLQDPDRVRRYALDDVAEVDGLSQRLLAASFALAGMAPRRFERVASAGTAMGILEPMLVRAYLRAGVALPRANEDAEDGLGPHAGGALHLFATGVARHVAKADIASLYPSLMSVYGIGPSSDRLGVLLRIVRRLTELRLAYKVAARQAAPGSLDAGHANALQAAMKLVINSAYGYLGAGPMALFADRAAADEVTRRGREILDQVIAALRTRGVALIEADTDGVYFSVPPGWTETEERTLVAEVAATLPAGIRLEYDGRYQAMFSHEVKNYALLTYHGELTIRGVALRSSRSEPFGEDFLRRALHALLRGDVVGTQQVYRETVIGLRTQSLPAASLATRTRLTKTPQDYLARRAAHREAPYEALINAGRTEWAVGEQVRLYRAANGTAVWLPDSGDRTLDERRDYDVEYYLKLFHASYVDRLRKAFTTEDFAQLFRPEHLLGLFDQPIEEIQPKWIAPGGNILAT